ncbi:MAG: hypothetical protein LW870_08940 [Pirellula sp.]|nr:hypothetical protein [Pirellula sp.]
MKRHLLVSVPFNLNSALFQKVDENRLLVEKTLDSEVAIFRTGSMGFLLQHHYHKDWDGYFMMQLMVDDLDAWWSQSAGME